MKKVISILPFLLAILAVTSSCYQEQVEISPNSVMATIDSTPSIGVDFVTKAVTKAVVRSATSTPMPEPTLTPTATPRVYIVSEGDTLFGIASSESITVEELMTLNPQIQPELLLIGQELVLPSVPEPMVETTHSSSVPLQVEILNLGYYPTPLDKTWVVGEVRNSGEAAVENLQVKVSYLSSGGDEEIEVFAWVATPIVEPNSAGPFGLLIPDTLEDVESLSADVVDGNMVVDLGDRHLDLAATDTEVTIDDGQVTFTGQIQNLDQFSVSQVTLTTSFYDKTGHLTGFHQWMFEGLLAPGEYAPFDLISIPPGPGTISYSFEIQGLVD